MWGDNHSDQNGAELSEGINPADAASMILPRSYNGVLSENTTLHPGKILSQELDIKSTERDGENNL